MANHNEVFIGIDTSKLRNAVAIAEAGRNGKVRYLGEIDTSEAATKKLVASLARKYRKLTFCYEAGPTGYGLHRHIESLGHSCIVAAPSLVPKKAGDRIKTNRRDAEGLARLLRAGELTAVWVPDARHEAMRELARARDSARQDLTRKRQQVSSMLLRMGLHYPGIRTWSARHRSWLANLKLEHAEHRFVLEELLVAERQAGERIGRLEQAIRDALGNWSLRDIVPALMAMRGIDMISAVTILAEIGDLTRFANPRQLMAYLGLVPSERSTGDAVRRGPITKAGNSRARRVLISTDAETGRAEAGDTRCHLHSLRSNSGITSSENRCIASFNSLASRAAKPILVSVTPTSLRVATSAAMSPGFPENIRRGVSKPGTGSYETGWNQT